MGIGRREFIKIFGATLATLAASPADAVSLVEDYYLNRKLGIGFQKPIGWSFMDVKEMGLVKSGQLLAIDDEVAAGELLDSMDLPFVSVSHRPKTSDSFAPSAQFYLIDNNPVLAELFDLGDQLERVLRELKGEEVSCPELPATIKWLHEDAKACNDALRSFEVISQPNEFQLSACDAAEYTATYLFEHQKLTHPTLVRTRTIFVNHRIASYLIRLVDSPAADSVNEFNFDRFVASIQLV